MQISLELKDGKQRIARYQCEVKNGNVEFSKLVNAITVAALTVPTSIVIPKEPIIEVEKIAEEIKKDTVLTSVVKPKKWEPEVISEGVVIHEEEKQLKKPKEIMLVAKCECGKTKIFKTIDNVGKVFKCDCGKEYPIENSIKMVADCPNCGHSSHGFRTLPGMDVSDFLKCKNCE